MSDFERLVQIAKHTGGMMLEITYWEGSDQFECAMEELGTVQERRVYMKRAGKDLSLFLEECEKMWPL